MAFSVTAVKRRSSHGKCRPHYVNALSLIRKLQATRANQAIALEGLTVLDGAVDGDMAVE
jgi:hypothetical protein